MSKNFHFRSCFYFLALLVWLAIPSPGISEEFASYIQATEHDEAVWQKLLEEENFAELDRIATELRTSKAIYKNGSSKLWRLYRTVSSISKTEASDEVYDQQVQRLAKWAEAIPESQTPQIALARCWFEWGFYSRGSGFAGEVTEEGWDNLRTRSTIAEKILDHVQEQFKHPDFCYYRTRIDVSRGLGNSPSQKLVFDALKQDPQCIHPMAGMITCLLPRWGGEPGELEEFIDNVVEKTEEQSGQYFYAIYASLMRSWYGDESIRTHKVDWNRVLKGLDDWERITGALQGADPLAPMAVQFGDWETAQRIILATGDNPDLDYWRKRKDYDIYLKHLKEGLFEGEHEQLLMPYNETWARSLFSPNCESLFITNSFNDCRFVDLDNQILGPSLEINQASSGLYAIYWKQGKMVVGSKQQEEHLKVIDIISGQMDYLECYQETPRGIHAIEGTSRLLVRCHDQNRIIILDFEMDKVVHDIALSGRARTGNAIISPDTKKVLIGTEGGYAIVIQLETGTEEAKWKAATGKIYGVAWSPD